MGKTYWDRKNAGLCVRCGRTARPGKIYCQECSETEKARNRDNYEWAKSNGICTMCHKAPAEKGLLCLQCWGDHSEQNKRWHDGHYDKAKESQEHRSRYARLKADGLCVVCGKRPSRLGRIECEYCAAKHSGRDKKDGPTKKEVWAQLGLCTTCGAAVVPGYKLCERCLENLRRARA